MKGKYTSYPSYLLARAKWGGVRAMLSAMSSWRPMEKPGAGYTMVIGCPGSLISILAANLAMVAKQDLASCRRIICVVDWTAERLGEDVGARIKREFPQLPLEFVYYTAGQARVLDFLGYPAGFCWFSWQLGLSMVRTQHALLHDFDAFLLKPMLLEERFRSIVSQGAQWLGQRWYEGSGVERTDRLTTTFEMFLDCEMVRGRFRPIDLFNSITMYKGRSVEFDITLAAQTVAGKALAEDMPEEEFVHPSQVVHQYTELTHKKGYVPPAKNRLPFVLYLLYLAGDEGAIARAREELAERAGFTMGGRWVDLSRTDAEHISWLEKQARLMEEALFGEMRDEVAAFFADVLARCGGQAVAGRRDVPRVAAGGVRIA